jgi:hypothetical protein
MVYNNLESNDLLCSAERDFMGGLKGFTKLKAKGLITKKYFDFNRF